MKRRLLLILGVITLIIGATVLGWRAYYSGRDSLPSVVSPARNESEVETEKLKLYMIALNDGGKKGKLLPCNDSLVEVVRTFPETDYITGAYEELLSLRDPTYPQTQLVNALAGSKLKVEKAILTDEGIAKIVLSGLLETGDDCDKARIRAQLEEPARRFWSVQGVEITINGQPLHEVLTSSLN